MVGEKIRLWSLVIVNKEKCSSVSDSWCIYSVAPIREAEDLRIQNFEQCFLYLRDVITIEIKNMHL